MLTKDFEEKLLKLDEEEKQRIKLRKREADERWKKSNPEKLKELSKIRTIKRRLKERTPEEKSIALEKTIIWQKNNPEKHKESKLKTYIKNKEKILIKRKEQRLKDPEKYNLAHIKWKTNNKEKYGACRQKIRAKRNSAPGNFTENDLKNIFNNQKENCVYCGASIIENYHIDHIYPLSRGGCNCKFNIQILCPSCNLRKADKNPSNFEKEIGYTRP